jgi:hypothetical protein
MDLTRSCVGLEKGLVWSQSPASGGRGTPTSRNKKTRRFIGGLHRMLIEMTQSQMMLRLVYSSNINCSSLFSTLILRRKLS